MDYCLTPLTVPWIDIVWLTWTATKSSYRFVIPGNPVILGGFSMRQSMAAIYARRWSLGRSPLYLVQYPNRGVQKCASSRLYHSRRISSLFFVHVFDLATAASTFGRPFCWRSCTTSPETSCVRRTQGTASRAKGVRRTMVLGQRVDLDSNVA